MPRRNHRTDQPVPIGLSDDLANIEIPPMIPHTRVETREERDKRLEAEFRRRRERTNRRADERIGDLLDWDVCCIPGCEEKNRNIGWRLNRDPSESLPICTRHEVMVRKQTEPYWDDQDYIEMRQKFERQRVEAELKQVDRYDLQHENGGAAQGQIYFVRQGGLVKVGWSSKLRSRLKAYGAGVTVLCHYPATRAEETDLHRQLRPYLAKGREWYQDCKLISDVVAGVVERHGEPTIYPDWTVPKKDVICSKRTA